MENLTPEELEEVEAWLTVAVAEAFLIPDVPVEVDASPEAVAAREEYARKIKAMRLQERFDAS